MSAKKKTIDIVTASVQLKKMLHNRLFNELKLNYRLVVEESVRNGIKGINKANLSKYFGSDNALSGTISQKSLLYLTTRYGIVVRINIKDNDYNEKDCLKAIKPYIDA